MTRPSPEGKTGLFLASAAALLFETLLPSYILFLRWHLFMLAVLGTVFLGICAGALLGRRLSPAACCLGTGASIAGFFALTLAAPFSLGILPNLFLHNLAIFVPFAFFGALVSRALAGESPGKVYAVHLAGCALGAAGGVFLLAPLGMERCVILAVAGCLWAALEYREAGAAPKWAAGALTVGVLLLPMPDLVRTAGGAAGSHPQWKRHLFEMETVEHTRWDPVGRIDVGPFMDGTWLYFNGIPFSPVGGPDRTSATRVVPFRLLDKPKVLVIGAGGGLDLATASPYTDDVTGVEISPSVVRLMRFELAEKTDAYRRYPVAVSDGRRFAAEDDALYDLVMVPFADAYSGFLFGNANLESYLYTREAFDDYRRRLRPGGLLLIVKWLGGRDPGNGDEMLRILDTALASRGGDAGDSTLLYSFTKKLPIVGERTQGHLLMKKGAFSKAEVSAARAAIRAAGCDILYAPKGPESNRYARLIASGRPDAPPLTDDKPFLYDTPANRGALRGIALFLGLSALVGAAALGWMTARDPSLGGARAPALCALLGCASLIFQLSVMQRLTLSLGSPVLSFAMVVLVHLLAAGAAGWASESGRWYAPGPARSLAAAAFLGPLILIAPLRAGLPWAAFPLMAASFFLTGLLFPSVLVRTRRVSGRSAYACWGAAAVGAAAGHAVFLWTSLTLGNVLTIGLAALLYALAAPLWLRTTSA